MEEVYIDTSKKKQAYKSALKKFLEDPRISQHNKELVQRFLREAALGKASYLARGPAGPSSLKNKILALQKLLHYTTKPLEEVTEEDMECFIYDLEQGSIPSLRNEFGWKEKGTRELPMSDSFKQSVKGTIKYFYKWLLGEKEFFPKNVRWIRVGRKVVPKQPLTIYEVRKLIACAGRVMQKAIIQVDFDSGFRVDELVNVRLRHVAYRPVHRTMQDTKRFFLTAPFSKTMPRTVVLLLDESDEWMKLWLEKHPANPRIRADGSILSDDNESQLFPTTPDAIRSFLRRLSRDAIGRHVNPHLLRHSSTQYFKEQGLSDQQLKPRAGWSPGSNMLSYYGDPRGVSEQETARHFFSQRS